MIASSRMGNERAQMVIEYCVLSAILLVGIVGLWKTLMRSTPGQLDRALQSAVRCMHDRDSRCR